MNQRIIKALKLIGFLSFGVLLLYLVYRIQNANYLDQCVKDGIPMQECSLIDKLLSDFSTLNYGWLVIITVAFFVSNVFRALRWHLLLKPLGSNPRFVNSFFSTMIGYFVNLGFPRAGEFARAGIFSRYEKVTFEQAVGTIVIGRATDVLCLILFILLTLLFEYQSLINLLENNAALPDINGLMVLGGIIVFMGFLSVFYIFRNQLKKAVFWD